MNMKSFSDIVKLHQEFSAMLTEQEKDLRERRKGTIDEMLPEMRAALKQAKAELDAVHRAKTEAVKRFDGEARRHEQTIAEPGGLGGLPGRHEEGAAMSAEPEGPPPFGAPGENALAAAVRTPSSLSLRAMSKPGTASFAAGPISPSRKAA